MTPLPDSLLEAVASAAVREGLVDAVFTRLNTPIGRLLVVQGENGIVRVGFEEEAEDHVLAEVAARLGPRILASDRELQATRDTLDAYFAGEGDPHELPVDLALVAAPFRHAVLEALHDSVPRGEVVTYGELAALAGRPGAARAAGSFCAGNRLSVFIPCHRVVAAGGLGGYGSLGLDYKRRLLALEHVAL